MEQMSPIDRSRVLHSLTVLCLTWVYRFWALMVDRVGRRPLFLIASSGMCCTFAIWIALTAQQLMHPEKTGFGKGVIAMIFFHNFFYNFAW